VSKAIAHVTKGHNDSHHGSLKTYSIGFLLSIVLTLTAYVLVVDGSFSRNIILLSISALAIMQLLVQLFFFLHIGHESKPRWNQTVLLYTLLTVGILVVGSLWIMHNLDYNHAENHQMSPKETEQYIIHDEGMSH